MGKAIFFDFVLVHKLIITCTEWHGTQVEPRAAGEWCYCKVVNILTLFLWSIRVQTMENCCRFVFYSNIDSFCRPCPYTFCGKSLVGKKKKTNCATFTSFPWSVPLPTIALDQSAGEKLLSYCKKIIVTNYFITSANGSCQ